MSEKRRALVVEDDPAWQDILDEILSDYGLQVDRAGNLDEAVPQLRGAAHLVAVVDLSLGYLDPHNQDGLLVLKALQRYDPACVPVLLTGFATVELAVSAIREYGALACLRKENFQRDSLEEWIDQALIQAPVRSQSPPTGRYHLPPVNFQTEEALRKEPSLSLDAIVVEDDSGWRSLVSELLEEEGFQAHRSNSYVEALGLLRRKSFNLAVVDLSLANSQTKGPNLDGYRLLENFAVEGTPTIVITG
ncbi:MAG: response regulator, partial [Anaerolineales bacterium]|nr:response regulator [Anaerolineales bacterium]